jgi:hypothetical protein
MTHFEWFCFILCVCLCSYGLVDSYKELQEIEALAYNCYFEARNSTIEDQIATMVTVMNRGKPSVEVYKKNQFSWTKEYAKPADNPALDKCKALAKMVYNNHDLFKSKDICKHYTSVHAKYGEGHWTKSFKRRTQIGKHYYYCN